MQSLPSEADASEPLPVLQLTNWKLREQPWVSIAIASGLVLASFAIGYISTRLSLGIGALAVFFIVTWRLWIPVSFELDARGIQQIIWKWRSFVPWECVARFELDDRGVLLLNEAGERAVSVLQGIYIQGGEQQQALVRLVEFYASRQPDLDQTIGLEQAQLNETHNS